MRLPLVALGLGVLVGSGAPAMEYSLRLGYEDYDSGYRVDLTGPSLERRESEHWNSDDAGFLGIESGVSLIHASLAATYRRRTDDGDVAEFLTYGGRAEAGLHVPLLPRLLHLEAMPYIGLARGDLELQQDAGSDKDHAMVTTYGIHLDAVLTPRRFVAGLGVGYEYGRTSFDNLDIQGPLHATLTEQVWLARVLLGWTF